MDSRDRLEPTVPALPARRMTTQPALAEASLLATPAGTTTGSVNIVQALLRVLAHHWWKILAIWAVLTAGLVYAIQVKVKPSYETFSLLRVEPAHRDLFGLGLNSAEVFDHFLQTQVELIRSPSVLLSAIASQDVTATSILREAKDPESELRGQLIVGVVPGSYLIRIGMASAHPREAAVIVNEVVKAYLEVANAWSSDKNKYQIKNLQDYNRELSDKVAERQKAWLELAEKSNVDLIDASPSSTTTLPQAAPSRVSVDEYRRVREQLFQTNMDMIEAEALLKSRLSEIDARTAGMDPELLIRKRVEDALRNDPQVAKYLDQITVAESKVDQASRRTRLPSDPSRRQAQQVLISLKQKLREICDEKRDELAVHYREQGVDDGPSLKELKAQIESMKVRKSSYEQLLGKIEVTNRQQGTDSVRVALVREDLSSLRGMQESVEKRIEQLHFDSRGEARINQIDKARNNGMLMKDSRKRLWAATPVGVIALVLGLFLFLEIRSGRVADLDEVSRRVPVEVYPVPSLPGTRRTSDQKALRANEAQLQEFLQSLDHLRVSLWFGKEAVAGSGRCLAVTSAVGGEGKTTLSAHLAVCCAKAGISTLVIDGDLRRAALSRMFEEEQSAGLSDVLKGDLPPEEAVIALRDGGFHLLPAGTPGQHPGWLFREQRIGQVLSRYRQMFDLVILDTPPILPVADALSLGRWVDGAIMVIRYDVSRFPLVDRARRRLISAGIPILKTVVNGVKSTRYGSSYGYGYSYGYGGANGYGERTPPADARGQSSGDEGARIVAAGSQETSSA
jgi:succinoglycan biosynthesis transport protein ExoP